MDDTSNGYEPFMSTRDMVAEVRSDQKQLSNDIKDLIRRVDKLATYGSNDKENLDDHESRIRALEVWKYGIPISGIVAIIGAVAAFLHIPA